MTQDEAFLQDIAEHPDDDTPRLVYADWLDDHGQPERAEFIRVQCESALLEEESLRRKVLEQRANELLISHRDEWLAALPGLPGIDWGDFTRGLVESVSARSFKAFQQQAPRIRRLIPLRRVSLQVGQHFKSFARADCLAGLKELGVWGRIGDAGAEALTGCPYLNELRVLSLHACGLGASAVRALAAAPFLPGLTELGLGANPDIGTEGVCALAASPDLTRLNRLRLWNTGAGAAGMRALAECASLMNLTWLQLSGNAGGDEAVRSLTASPIVAPLKTLLLGGNQIGPAGVQALTSCPRLASLRLLELADNPVGPEGAKILAQSRRLMSLHTLWLNNCGLGDAGARGLASATGLSCLEYLSLSDNGIGNVGAVALASSRSLRHLETLVLHRNPISEAGGRAFLQSRGLRSLKTLWMGAEHFSVRIHEALTTKFGQYWL